MTVIDNAVYVEGHRYAEPASLEDTYGFLRDQRGMGWIGLYRPDAEELQLLAEELLLHGLVIEDAISAHQRPKLERYGDTSFTVLRPARYVEEEERVEFGEIHVFTGPNFVVTVRHAESPDLALVRDRMEENPHLLSLGPTAVLFAIFDQVVDEYVPVVAGLQNDIDEIEDEVFDGDTEVSRRIYELIREVIGFQRATEPLFDMVTELCHGGEDEVDEELQHHLRDVQDHITRIVERGEGFRVLLQNILTVNATLVAQRQNEEAQRMNETSLQQNEEVKKISAWAAILFTPTLVGTVYGMNFKHMPELHWHYGYPLALTMMLLTGLALYVVFRRRDWL